MFLSFDHALVGFLWEDFVQTAFPSIPEKSLVIPLFLWSFFVLASMAWTFRLQLGVGRVFSGQKDGPSFRAQWILMSFTQTNAIQGGGFRGIFRGILDTFA